MSAIWGAISLEGKEISKGTRVRMQQAYEIYKIDRIEDVQRENVMMGCGIQYFTKESRQEKLPISEEDCFFTADVVLDNRSELLEDLKLSEERVIPDGEILWRIYRKYGEECLNRLLGSYIFVVYDKKENTISVVSDATGTRCLYYRYEKGVFYFSTIIEALWNPGEKKKMNERWVMDFLALDNLVGITECTETMYQGIYKVEPAHFIKISKNGIEKKCYWDPKPKEIKLKSDAEYKQKMIDIFGEAVRCLLRADKTAMMLSGGLDSSSIACFAAPELKKRGETLHAFTSVPDKTYQSNMSAFNVTDESEKAKKTGEFLGNVENHLIELKGKDPWTSHYEIKKALEIPYKSPQNMQWLIQGLQEAEKLGARIVLEGGYGNVTISYGNPVTYLETLLFQKRFISYIKEINCFARKHQWGRRQKIKIMFSMAKRYYFAKEGGEKDSVLGKAYIKKEKIQEFMLEDRISKIYQKRTENRMDVEKNREIMLDRIQCSHKGEIKTKESLMTGVLFRDPCMDKRVIEFCISLPMEQYCYRGVTRRLVREYFSGIVPDHVIKDERYGCQSADMLWKLKQNWNVVYQEMNSIFEQNEDSTIVDTKAAEQDLKKIGENIMEQDNFDFIRLFYTSMMLETIREKEL